MSMTLVSSKSSPLFGHVDRLASSHPRSLRYAKSGAQLIRDAATKAIKTLKALPAGQKESFASGFETVILELGEKASEMVKRREVMPIELPPPLPQPNVMFKAKRRRGYTRREAAEEAEKDRRRALVSSAHDANAERAEERAWSKELKAKHVARHAAARAAGRAAVSSLVLGTASSSKEVIIISSDDSDKTESLEGDKDNELVGVKAKDVEGMNMLVERHSPLLVSQDPSEAENAKESEGGNKS
jgi:hypothetical protein